MLRRLSAHGEVGFTELADEFGVSEMTIRRDLETLEADGLARRVRGGAISVVSRSYEPPLAVRATTESAAKTAIGAAAGARLASAPRPAHGPGGLGGHGLGRRGAL